MFPETTCMACVTLILGTLKIKGIQNALARVTEASVPKVRLVCGMELVVAYDFLTKRAHGAEVTGGITSVENRPCWKIHDGKAKRVKLHNNIFVMG